jgi:hypothetical protein
MRSRKSLGQDSQTEEQRKAFQVLTNVRRLQLVERENTTGEF